MTRELWLMRHGKAQRFDGVEDYDRQLKKSGKRAARAIGEWLNKNLLQPDLIISSPAARAFATAKIVSAEIGLDIQDIMQDKRLYDEGLVRVKSVLADCPDRYQKVLLVGHNPELESLLIYLLDPVQLPKTEKAFPTAALARLKLPGDWSHLEPKCAALLSMIFPKGLLEDEGFEA